jgi:hypothetical protein
MASRASQYYDDASMGAAPASSSSFSSSAPGQSGPRMETICVCQFHGLRGPSSQGVHAAMPGSLYCQKHATIMLAREAKARSDANAKYFASVADQIRLKHMVTVEAQVQAEMMRRMEERNNSLDAEVQEDLLRRSSTRTMSSQMPSQRFESTLPSSTQVPPPSPKRSGYSSMPPPPLPKAQKSSSSSPNSTVPPLGPSYVPVQVPIQAPFPQEAEQEAGFQDEDEAFFHNLEANGNGQDFMPEMFAMLDAWKKHDAAKKRNVTRSSQHVPRSSQPVPRSSQPAQAAPSYSVDELSHSMAKARLE